MKCKICLNPMKESLAKDEVCFSCRCIAEQLAAFAQVTIQFPRYSNKSKSYWYNKINDILYESGL